MGFQVVTDMDELRESVELTVDMNWSLADATLNQSGRMQERTMPLVLHGGREGRQNNLRKSQRENLHRLWRKAVVEEKKKAQSKMDKISSRWAFVQSGDFWVATKAGVNKARSVRRIAEEDRWSNDYTCWVKNVPWPLYQGHLEADGDIPEVVRPVDDMESPLVVVGTREVPPRAFQIRNEKRHCRRQPRVAPRTSVFPYQCLFFF